MTEMMTMMKTCIFCGKPQHITAPDEAWIAWNAGAKVQNAFPMLSLDEREILISGICGKCFDAMFEGEE